MSEGKKFIGLDVHQDTIAIAIADDGVDKEVRYYGTIANRPEALHAALKKIGQDGAPEPQAQWQTDLADRFGCRQALRRTV